MTFEASLDEPFIQTTVQQSLQTTDQQAQQVLRKSAWSLADLPTLLSPAMGHHIEPLAQHAHQLTVQRFGKTIQLFVPMYLSNQCFNRCTYCGFSMDHDYPRKTLTDSEILLAYQLLHKKGFRHILLLTGEAPGKVDSDYIGQAISMATPYFDSIGIEVQPFDQPTYQQLIQQGANQLTLYQETYHRPTYLTHHLSGKKRRYDQRLLAVESGAKANFNFINIGILLGLYDWRYDAYCLAQHLIYLRTHYWQTQFGVSFPRIQHMIGDYDVAYKTHDLDYTQLICAFRLLFPDIPISLTTREQPALRDHLIPLGITLLSAESKTNPGGYLQHESVSQFDISDHRSLQEIDTMVTTAGYELVYKDWEPV